jgi:hypothetical protein
MLGGFGGHGVEGDPEHRRPGLVPPLVQHVDGDLLGVALGHGVALAAAHQGPGAFQNVDRVLWCELVWPGSTTEYVIVQVAGASSSEISLAGPPPGW